MISRNVIIPFDGADASIPNGFTRDTRFDDKFPKGAEADLGDAGGTATHTHTFDHNHTIASHTHTADVYNERDAQYTTQSNINPDHACTGHDHPGGAITGAAQTQVSATTDLTYDDISSDPSYYEVIFIKSNGENPIPANGMMFHAGSDRPGLTYHTASQDKFLKGASTGGNAGGTGGADSHAHSQTHTHTANNHGHSSGYLHGYSGQEGQGGTYPADIDNNRHGTEHIFNVSGAKQNMNSNTTISGDTSVEPVHKTLKHYKATTSQIPQPGDIAMITESTPIGWKLCDGTDDTPDMDDYFLKNTDTAKDTGGENTHTHTTNHGHSASGTHTHPHDTYSAFSNAATDGKHISAAMPYVDQIGKHRHEIRTFNSVAAAYKTTTGTSTSTNNEPEYIKVKFIQFEFSVTGGSFIYNLL